MEPRPDHVFAGIAVRLLAVVFVTAMAATIKLAEAHGAHLAEIIFFRQAGALPLVLAVVARGPGLRSVATQRIGAHALRMVVGTASMACLFGSLLMLPLAEATTFQFSMPIFATVLGALILKEPTGWHRWGAVIAGFAGVLIVAQPGSGHVPPLGAVVGLAAALFSALVSILLRSIGRTESTYTTVFWFTVLSLPVLGSIYAFNIAAHPLATWGLLMMVGLFGGAGQLALTASLRLAPISVVLPMEYSALLWATLYGWLLFGVLPGDATWIGAPLIIGSGLYIVWRERVRHRETVRAVVQ